MAAPGRFLVGTGSSSLTWAPTWTALDTHPNLVTSYTIDRGRQFELDRTDTGRATVEIADTDGTLATPLEPLTQAMIQRRNPVTGGWETRFRGFVEESDYTFHPSQKVNMLTVSLVDIFEILGATEMQPGEFGDLPPAVSTGQVFFKRANEVRDRMNDILGLGAALYPGADIPTDFIILFSGNVAVKKTVYSPGESVLDALQEAADAEFPGVGNCYTDRFGRFVFHGRLAKFYPDAIAASTTPDRWDYHAWKAGDGAAVAASPGDTAHVREFAYNRGLAKIINTATAAPVGIKDGQVAAQLVKDSASRTARGIRSWSAQNLLTEKGNLDGSTDLVETKRFATYYVQNYKGPHDRITTIGFRAMNPLWTGAAANWDMLSKIDISDTMAVQVGSDAGGLTGDFFVEGIHEEARMLTPDYDDVTMRLDLSPRALYTTNPFPS